ncbi:tail fiber assembly protein [Pantoea sp. B270]|uniref:tail fiber assembly protein n=1 Tax=Pantoea sp. B270 TaxID=2836826 RepID=UPI001BFF2D62|nr:tail fiber assembly protein [Pantoea sp. B270]MBU6520574.1 tail fiber assembly protein [Pantoea sp. B270]
MKTYARIEEQRVAEIVSLDVKPEKLYHPSLVWVDISALETPPDVNYLYRDGVFSAPVIEAEDPVFLAASRQAVEMEEASRLMAPLQDAVDIGKATQEEIARLNEWKEYRVMLNRIDTTKAPDIDWPQKPA